MGTNAGNNSLLPTAALSDARKITALTKNIDK
jgi:hypothetical protein